MGMKSQTKESCTHTSYSTKYRCVKLNYLVLVLLLINFSCSPNIGVEKYYVKKKSRIFKQNKDEILRVKNILLKDTEIMKVLSKRVYIYSSESTSFECMHMIEDNIGNYDSLLNVINNNPVYSYSEVYEEFSLVIHYTPVGMVLAADIHHHKDSIYTKSYFPPYF